MTEPTELVSPANAEAKAMVNALLAAKHAALSFVDAETGKPGISRIAFGRDPDGRIMTFISSLAPHFASLKANSSCAIMLGEPGLKGDPLSYPRLMLRAKAQFLAPDAAGLSVLRAAWLKGHPKAALYLDFTDFAFVRFTAVAALLNGGFAKAWHLSAADMGLGD